MTTWTEIKEFMLEVCAEVEKEAGSISQDQKFYADYLCNVKEFKPWIETTEKKIKESLVKPTSLDDALSLLENCKSFDEECEKEKQKLEDASKARSSMEKASSTENEVAELTKRWETAKKVAIERVEKVQMLVSTWDDLKKTTLDLNTKMAEVPALEEPNLEDMEKVFGSLKDLFAKKKELLGSV